MKKWKNVFVKKNIFKIKGIVDPPRAGTFLKIK
jgi:hypothetical protein